MEEKTPKRGDWVEIEWVVLPPEDRSPSVPLDTSAVPYMARTKGFLVEDARVGDVATVETIIGRRLTGTLIAVNPPFGHDFGRPVPELLRVGNELRALLTGGLER